MDGASLLQGVRATTEEDVAGRARHCGVDRCGGDASIQGERHSEGRPADGMCSVCMCSRRFGNVWLLGMPIRVAAEGAEGFGLHQRRAMSAASPWRVLGMSHARIHVWLS